MRFEKEKAALLFVHVFKPYRRNTRLDVTPHTQT